MTNPGATVETPSPGTPPPVGGEPTASPMAAGQAAGGMGVPPMSGSADPAAISSIVVTALQQFDQIQQMILSLAQAFPGNEMAARMMMDGLEQWRQNIVVSTAPTPPMMPGAAQMM